MRWLELVGSSGIGKSYWFDQLCAARRSDLGPRKIIQRAATSGATLRSVRLRSRFQLHSLRTGTVPYSNGVRWWTAKIPRSELEAALGQPTCVVLDALQRESPERHRGFSSAEAEQFGAWYRRRPLTELAIVLRWSSGDDLVLFEEGAVQNNPALGSPEAPTPAVLAERGSRLPDVAILLKSDPDRIVERRRRRLHEGRGRLTERGRTTTQLLRLVEAESLEASSKAAWLQQGGVEIIEVGVDRPIDRVVRDLTDIVLAR